MDLPKLKIGNDKETYLPAYIEDRYTGTLVMGKSSHGKSVNILNWWQQDTRQNTAKALVDPSGFLARDCYSISGGTYCSLDNPVSFNFMRLPYSPSQKVDILIEATNQVITSEANNERVTVKMIDMMSEAVKECITKNRLSLLSVRDYIANMKGGAETRDGIISRLNFLLDDPAMEKMLCGQETINWYDITRKQKTVILDCFGMSHSKMVFLGTIFTQSLKNYFRFERPREYYPLAIYIDECHNFINANFVDVLKEGRKYKLACVLATQDFAVTSEMMTRVMLNVGNIVSYRLGAREAQYVAKELDIAPQDIQFIDKYHAAYMTVKGRGIAKAPRPPFFKPRKPPKFVEPKRKATPSWFSIESYQPASHHA